MPEGFPRTFSDIQYFTDNGIGTSIDNDTSTEYSSPDNFENQICDLQSLRQKLLAEENKKDMILKKIHTEKSKFNQERLQSEKNILSSTLRTRLLLADFKQKYESQRNKNYFNIGSVTISDIKLHYNKTQYSRKFKQYFLCALTTGSKLFLSQIVQADSEDIVNFNINHTFFNLSVNFEIGVKIYILSVRKKYMGSFSVATSEQISKSGFLHGQVQQMLGSSRKKYVLLVISLAGIKVCSPDGKIVHMAHALRRISYATCDPDHRLFSFLAREPKGHFNQQYCHSFISRSPEQAEELNSIVGNAFRMAYAAQLQKQPTFQDVIASQLDQTQTNKVLWTKELSVTLKKDKSSHQANNNQASEMDVQLTNTDASTLRLAPPTTIPGLKPSHKYNVLGPSEKPQSQQSTPSSDESNSPTEMNSYKRMTEKPPLIKRIAMGLTGNHHDNDEDSCPLVSENNSTPGSPTNRPLSGGYVNESTNDTDNRINKTNVVDNLKNDIVESINSNLTKHIEIDNSRLLQNSPASTEQEFKSKRISQISSSSSSSCPQTGTETTLLGLTPTPPPLPERTDSLNNKEEGELRTAPWFQAGIPREIALEILAQEPVGAFMVRESTSKPGCFALSLRVPRSFQPTGIAHYLIVRTNKGYKIKGFTKEFTTLTSLITHHSVMPELLPCPLSLSRYNPSFVKSDSKRDFADIDLDPDYNTLADFRKMMADLNV